MMTPRAVLLLQVDTLIAELSHEQQAIAIRASAPAPLVVGRLATTVNKCVTDLVALRNGLTDSMELKAACQTLQRLRKDATDLFGESLALAIAPVMRQHALDAGMCEVADRLLASLSQAFVLDWPHFTILSESDYFNSTAQLIRLRYPVSAVWDLTVAAHEFGHYFGPRWRDEDGTSPYETFLQQRDLGTVRSHYAELFADLFAVFALGPAYAATCVLQRFNPWEGDSDTHPSHPRRVAWILSCLDKLAHASLDDGVGIVGKIRARLATYWEAAMHESQVTPPNAESINAMPWQVQKLWKTLLYQFGGAAYLDMRPAFAVRAAFTEHKPAGDLQHAYRLRDVLNGLWLLRLDYGEVPQTTRELQEWGRTLCMGARA